MPLQWTPPGCHRRSLEAAELGARRGGVGPRYYCSCLEEPWWRPGSGGWEEDGRRVS